MQKILFLIIIIITIGTLVGCKDKVEVISPIEEILKEIPKVEEEIEEIEEVVEVERKERMEIGLFAPNFTLKNLNGNYVSLTDYKGKIIILNFWATWNDWCEKEITDFIKLEEENDDLKVLFINVNEEQNIVENYINEKGFKIETLLDVNEEIYNSYLGAGFPNSYFVDKEGILLGKVGYAMTYEDMIELVRELREMN